MAKLNFNADTWRASFLQRLRDLPLTKGLNPSLFEIINALRLVNEDESFIRDFLLSLENSEGRKADASEVGRALKMSRDAAAPFSCSKAVTGQPQAKKGNPTLGGGRVRSNNHKYSGYDEVLSKQVIDGFDNKATPLPVSRLSTPELFIDAVYDSDDLITLGMGLPSGKGYKQECKTASEWLISGVGDYNLIVPNPMRKCAGVTLSGKPSARSKDNASETFNVYVHECDMHPIRNSAGMVFKEPLVKQKAIILELARYAPLFCLVDSGNKSIHAWFGISGMSEDAQIMFIQLSISLGGDPSAPQTERFMRLPNAMRNSTTKQTLLNFHK